MVPIVREAGDLIVVVAGGAGGKSMFLPTAGGQASPYRKRSRPIERGDDTERREGRRRACLPSALAARRCRRRLAQAYPSSRCA
jgi:hypothetical protein